MPFPPTAPSPEFRADLHRMVYGEDHVTPAAKGVWSSFCKTQYANSPECGGWKNFARAHIAVLAVLEHLQSLGFKVVVGDEGHFWETRNLGTLAKPSASTTFRRLHWRE